MKANDIIKQLELNSRVYENLLTNVSEEETKWKPSDDKWSLLEVVCHLHDEESADFRARFEKILHKDHNWDPIDTQGWVTSRNYKDKDFGNTVKKFLDERKKSVDWLKKLEVDDWSIEAVHPQLGSFNALQMLSSWLAHDYLHFRQINKLRYQYLEEKLKPLSLEYAGGW